jgi:transcriptional regulator with XRE-family HTH domain
MFIDSTQSVIEVSPVVNRKPIQSVKMNFAEWLKEQRDKASLTQGELSERTDRTVSVSMISSIESGTRKASRDTVNRLARALGAKANEALRLAGFASGQPEEREPPQTVSELLERLDELGVGAQFFGGLESIPDDPETLAAILQDIETVLALRARRLPPNESNTRGVLPG